MSREFLKPSKPDLIVRDPVTYLPLRAEGEWKELNSYWRRRKAAGEVNVATPTKKAKPVAAKSSASKAPALTEMITERGIE